jgi:hypothetical protein
MEEGDEIAVHEGERTILTEEQFNNMSQADQTAINQIVADTGISMDEAATTLQNMKNPEIEQTGLDERIIADNVADAIDAAGGKVVGEGIIGLAEAKGLKSILKKGHEAVGAFHTRRYAYQPHSQAPACCYITWYTGEGCCCQGGDAGTGRSEC